MIREAIGAFKLCRSTYQKSPTRGGERGCLIASQLCLVATTVECPIVSTPLAQINATRYYYSVLTGASSLRRAKLCAYLSLASLTNDSLSYP